MGVLPPLVLGLFILLPSVPVDDLFDAVLGDSRTLPELSALALSPLDFPLPALALSPLDFPSFVFVMTGGLEPIILLFLFSAGRNVPSAST